MVAACRGLGRGLSARPARASGQGKLPTRRDRGAHPALGARDGRADGGHIRRLPGKDHAWHDALAASALLRLFPGKCSTGFGRRGVSGLGDGRPMHAVANVASRHRTRNRDDRLAPPGGRPAGGVFRRDPGFGVLGDAGCPAHDARTGARLAGQPLGTVGTDAAARLCFRSGPQLGRPRRLDCRYRRGQPGEDTDWRAAPLDDSGRPRARDPEGPRRRTSSRRHRRLRRRNQHRSDGRHRRNRLACPPAPALPACRCGVGGIGHDLPGIQAFLVGSGSRRFHRDQPSQMAGRAIRLLRAFHSRPRQPGAHFGDQAGVPQDARQGRRHRLFGLDGAARPPLPRAEAVVSDASVRARRPQDHDTRPRDLDRRTRGTAGRPARLRDRDGTDAVAVHFPPSRTGRPRPGRAQSAAA